MSNPITPVVRGLKPLIKVHVVYEFLEIIVLEQDVTTLVMTDHA